MQPPGGLVAPPHSRTWAELAWLLIGAYWIVMGVFILPFRLQSFRFGDTVLFGLVPLCTGLVFRLFGPSSPSHHRPAPWTHQVAVGLLATWPCLALPHRAGEDDAVRGRQRVAGGGWRVAAVQTAAYTEDFLM